ncbi:hypothetical protein LOD99_14861 [Oopsacas minuta]|uniref:Uncharacterized protein n=1 Tax=Oopsacas minuta TaxID=111878 RepID=A0AAV7KDD3_9METZ|nr:hypothetical protein LOD99_14861 [Oopsacas minuta]
MILALLVLIPSCVIFFITHDKELLANLTSNDISFPPNTTVSPIPINSSHYFTNIFKTKPLLLFLQATAPNETGIQITINDSNKTNPTELMNCSVGPNGTCIVLVWDLSSYAYVTLNSSVTVTTTVDWTLRFFNFQFLISAVILGCSSCIFITFLIPSIVCCCITCCDEDFGNHKGAKFVTPQVSYHSFRNRNSPRTINPSTDRTPLFKEQKTETGYVDGVKVTRHYSAFGGNNPSKPFVQDSCTPPFS